MGNTVQLPVSTPPAQVYTEEMLLSAARMLETLPVARPGEYARIGLLVKDSPSFAATTAALRDTFPEFELVETAERLFALVRHRYSGDPSRCCIQGTLTHYWEDANGRISSHYSPRHRLRTCDPETKDSSTFSACDDTMLDFCSPMATSLPRDDEHREVCARWLGSAMQRTDGTPDRINSKYSTACIAAGADHPLCEDWLHVLRATGGTTYDETIDTVLVAQTDEFKRTHMRCSFPDRSAIHLASRIIEPRECWDPECLRANTNFLLSRNYHDMSLCHIYRCNVSIDNLILDERSNVKLSCRTPADAGTERVLRNRARVIERNLDRSFAVRTGLLFLMALLISWVLIVLL
ncbi:entry/fusion complex component myristylprotein [Western grey kangaroopox virus]|uniref:Entry/fusion complex component myristylprotein n=1 Tax=Western grey kangaroopox virus TaxID=1566307 RepID=A0A2C9DSM0_9POXV|nr:entry/fusion complex component myristylprotein [Western grey kangaroopox virus]ATI21003.1 entry/fusion complex component myristylprotein [Western grey kangaroopox virus]